jgi:hypothetical protein
MSSAEMVYAASHMALLLTVFDRDLGLGLFPLPLRSVSSLTVSISVVPEAGDQMVPVYRPEVYSWR